RRRIAVGRTRGTTARGSEGIERGLLSPGEEGSGRAAARRDSMIPRGAEEEEGGAGLLGGPRLAVCRSVFRLSGGEPGQEASAPGRGGTVSRSGDGPRLPGRHSAPSGRGPAPGPGGTLCNPAPSPLQTGAHPGRRGRA